MPFPAASIVLDIIILTEVCQREANTIWYHLHVNLKCDTNELIYEIETDSQTQRADLWLPSGGVGEAMTGTLGLADAHYYI